LKDFTLTPPPTPRLLPEEFASKGDKPGEEKEEEETRRRRERRRRRRRRKVYSSFLYLAGPP